MSALPSESIIATASREVEFTAFGTALPAGSKRLGVASNGRRFVRDDNPNTSEWKRTVAQAAGAAMNGRPLLDGALTLVIQVYRPRPQSHYGKNGLRPAAPPFPTTRPDITKLVRAIEDALTGVLARDDSQFVEVLGIKRYGEPARVEVKVSRL